ncbi:MAG: hypothetical protein U7123_02685 [Potamolinea sp.]
MEKIEGCVETLGNLWGKIGRKIRILTVRGERGEIEETGEMGHNVGAGLEDNLTLRTANLSNKTRPRDGGDGGRFRPYPIPNPQSPISTLKLLSENLLVGCDPKP